MPTRIALFVICAMLTACGQETPVAPEPTAPSAAAPSAAAPVPAPAATLPRKPAPPDVNLYFIEPADGAVVANPVRVVFGLKGMGVAPAGNDRSDAGHHHLLVDTAMPANLAAPIPNDAQHVHFGGGQTETTLTLTPGRHTLQLLLGDHLHVPFDPPIASPQIAIEVQ